MSLGQCIIYILAAIGYVVIWICKLLFQAACGLIGLIVGEAARVDWPLVWNGIKKSLMSIDWGAKRRQLEELTKKVYDQPVFKLIRREAAGLYQKIPDKYRLVLEGGLLVICPVAALKTGFFFSDWDINFLGIRWHRFFLFHSAIGAVLLKRFFESYQAYIGENNDPLLRRVVGVMAAAGAMGIALHLAKDTFIDGNKSVVFGLSGLFGINTPVRGTWVDDDIYLLANSLWAFKVSRDIFIMAFGDDLTKVKQYVGQVFAGGVTA